MEQFCQNAAVCLCITSYARLVSTYDRKLEQEMETVVKVLQPGPLGIIEHKFSSEEIHKANATVSKAVANWRRNATLEDKSHILKDYISK